MKKKIILTLIITVICCFSAIASRDNTNNIVTDNRTGLMWQDDSDASSVKDSWGDAIVYCENKTLGGYSDWRLPNIRELYSIVDRRRYNLSINTDFINAASGRYWSSTTMNSSNNTFADTVEFNYGQSSYQGKSYTSLVRCVRGGKTIK